MLRRVQFYVTWMVLINAVLYKFVNLIFGIECWILVVARPLLQMAELTIADIAADNYCGLFEWQSYLHTAVMAAYRVAHQGCPFLGCLTRVDGLKFCCWTFFPFFTVSWLLAAAEWPPIKCIPEVWPHPDLIFSPTHLMHPSCNFTGAKVWNLASSFDLTCLWATLVSKWSQTFEI